jgi:hypothetical protein
MSGRFGVVPEVGEVGIRNSLKPLLHSSTVASEVTEMVGDMVAVFESRGHRGGV